MSDREDLRKLVKLGLAAQAAERKQASEALVQWIEHRDSLGPSCSPQDAVEAIHGLLELVRSLADGLWHRSLDGQDVRLVDLLRKTRQPSREQDRVQQLKLLQSKLRLVAPLMDGLGSRQSSLACSEEIQAVLAGDTPRLFAAMQSKRKRGQPTNAYRISRLKLRALEWDAVLRARGMRATDRHMLVQDSFGATWDAILKWRAPCRRELGKAFVDRSLSSIATLAESPIFGERAGLTQDDALRYDGEQYRHELRLAAG